MLPVRVAGLRATARLVEPLQHRTRSSFMSAAAPAAKTSAESTDLTLTAHVGHGARHRCKDAQPCVCFLQKGIQKGFIYLKNLNE